MGVKQKGKFSLERFSSGNSFISVEQIDWENVATNEL